MDYCESVSGDRAVIANIFPQGFNKSARLKNRLHATCRHRDKGYILVGFVAFQPARSRARSNLAVSREPGEISVNAKVFDDIFGPDW